MRSKHICAPRPRFFMRPPRLPRRNSAVNGFLASVDPAGAACTVDSEQTHNRIQRRLSTRRLLLTELGGLTVANKLTDARRSLVRAKQAAQQRLEDIENEKREIKASLRSLEAALKALSKTTRPKAATRQADEVPADSTDQETNPDSQS